MIFILDGKTVELTETEECIFDLLVDFSIELDDKIRLIFHFQSKLSDSVFSYFLQITDFVEILKKRKVTDE